MIYWLSPPFKRGQQVVIVLRSGRRLRAEVITEAAPGGVWPPHVTFRTIKTVEQFTTIGTGPDAVVGIGSQEEKADDDAG